MIPMLDLIWLVMWVTDIIKKSYIFIASYWSGTSSTITSIFIDSMNSLESPVVKVRIKDVNNHLQVTKDFRLSFWQAGKNHQGWEKTSENSKNIEYQIVTILSKETMYSLTSSNQMFLVRYLEHRYPIPIFRNTGN